MNPGRNVSVCRVALKRKHKYRHPGTFCVAEECLKTVSLSDEQRVSKQYAEFVHLMDFVSIIDVLHVACRSVASSHVCKN